MSATDGRAELSLPDRTITPGRTLSIPCRFWRLDHGVWIADDVGPVHACLVARDHHTRVPDYNPFPVIATPTGRDGKWHLVCAGDTLRPGLLRALSEGALYLTVFHTGSRLSLPLTITP